MGNFDPRQRQLLVSNTSRNDSVKVSAANGLQNSMIDVLPATHKPVLFRLPEWLSAWEATWGKTPGLVSVNNENLPFNQHLYAFIDKKIPAIALRTLIPAGVSVRQAPSIRAEYFCYEKLTEFSSLLSRLLCEHWDQFYIPDLIAGSSEYLELKNFCISHNYKMLVRDTAVSYGIDLDKAGNFNAYLAALGKNTRLKLYNRRTRLNEEGAISVDNLWPDLDRFIAVIDKFHSARWGKPCFSQGNKRFIACLLDNLSEAGYAIDLSLLSLNGKPLSAVLDINVNGRIYNIQSGYIENYLNGVSLGTLHFGYQIEKAFKDGAANYYDFMAGEGKSSNYKEHLANNKINFMTALIIKPSYLKLAYFVNDFLKGYKNNN